MSLFKGHSVDIWAPAVLINSADKVLEGKYSIHQSNIDAFRVELKPEKKIQMGLNVSQSFCTFLFGPNVLTGLDQFYIIGDRGDKTVYLIHLPIIHWETPLEYWRAIGMRLRAPTKTISDYYASLP